jgi:hypothetical protein
LKYLIVGENIEKYSETDDLKDIVIKHNIHFCTCLNIWGESHCYYLTKIINTGVSILYNNIGAISERIPDEERYIKVFDSENDVYNYDILKLKFEEMLEFILKNNFI